MDSVAAYYIPVVLGVLVVQQLLVLLLLPVVLQLLVCHPLQMVLVVLVCHHVLPFLERQSDPVITIQQILG